MSAPDTAPKETAELLAFLCAFGKVATEAYTDDRRISVWEVAGMLGLLRDGMKAVDGIEKIGGEVNDLTPEQMRKLSDIVAQGFHKLIPVQHEAIVLAGLACLPTLVNFLQTIRSASALAAEFPGENAPRATPA